MNLRNMLLVGLTLSCLSLANAFANKHEAQHVEVFQSNLGLASSPIVMPSFNQQLQSSTIYSIGKYSPVRGIGRLGNPSAYYMQNQLVFLMLTHFSANQFTPAGNLTLSFVPEKVAYKVPSLSYHQQYCYVYTGNGSPVITIQRAMDIQIKAPIDKQDYQIRELSIGNKKVALGRYDQSLYISCPVGAAVSFKIEKSKNKKLYTNYAQLQDFAERHIIPSATPFVELRNTQNYAVSPINISKNTKQLISSIDSVGAYPFNTNILRKVTCKVKHISYQKSAAKLTPYISLYNTSSTKHTLIDLSKTKEFSFENSDDYYTFATIYMSDEASLKDEFRSQQPVSAVISCRYKAK